MSLHAAEWVAGELIAVTLTGLAFVRARLKTRGKD